jgi:hypothetical protein
MTEVEPRGWTPADFNPEMLVAQLELLTHDEIFRASRRSIAFPKYVVEETPRGPANRSKSGRSVPCCACSCPYRMIPMIGNSSILRASFRWLTI